MGLAGGKGTRDESVMAIRETRAINEQILYQLSLDFRSHELGEALR